MDWTIPVRVWCIEYESKVKPYGEGYVPPLRFPALLETRPHGTSRSAPKTQNGVLSVNLGLVAQLIRTIYTIKVKPNTSWQFVWGGEKLTTPANVAVRCSSTRGSDGPV